MSDTRTTRRSLLSALEEAESDLDEWCFTNKVDELCRRVDRAESELAATRKQLAEVQADLQHLAEYWNRDENEMAMKDACWHTIEVAESSDTSALQSAIAEAVATAVEPYKRDAELGRIAMQFVDRAGDVHPGIDDAETICAEFYEAIDAALAAKEM